MTMLTMLTALTTTTTTTERRHGNRKGWMTKERVNTLLLVLLVVVVSLITARAAMSRNRARTRFWMSCGRCVQRDSAQTRRAWCGTTRRCGDLYEVGACGEDLVMDVERCPMVFRDALCGKFRAGVMTGALCEAYDVVRALMKCN